MRPQLSPTPPCPTAPEPALDPDAGWLEPLNLLVDRSPSLARWRSFRAGEQVIPSFVLIGPRGHGVPIRLALIAGLAPEDTVATAALAKLLVDFDLAPLLAQDYALFGYPQADAKTRGACHNDANDFWRGSADPAVRFLERELEGNQFDGVIFIQGN